MAWKRPPVAITRPAGSAAGRGRRSGGLQGIAARRDRLEVDRIAERVDRPDALQVSEIGRVLGQEAVAQRRRSGSLERESVDHDPGEDLRAAPGVRHAELIAVEERVLIAGLVGRRPRSERGVGHGATTAPLGRPSGRGQGSGALDRRSRWQLRAVRGLDLEGHRRGLNRPLGPFGLRASRQQQHDGGNSGWDES